MPNSLQYWYHIYYLGVGPVAGKEEENIAQELEISSNHSKVLNIGRDYLKRHYMVHGSDQRQNTTAEPHMPELQVKFSSGYGIICLGRKL